MRLGLRMGLNNRQSGGSALDPDARLYIAAVETALGTPIAAALPNATTDPKRIISDFIKSEKVTSRWALHKRIYLPIYNNAAASAIDMASRTSGEFIGIGTVTHAAGYVQGNGSSGYFDCKISPTAAGFSATDGSMFSLISLADTRTDARSMVGVRDNVSPATGECNLYQGSATVVQTLIGRGTSTPLVFISATTNNGLLHANRNSSTGLILSQRKTSGVSRSAANTGTAQISTFDFSVMALNTAGVRSQYTNARLGAYGFGLGLADNASCDAFTLNLKNLYESLTGIALP